MRRFFSVLCAVSLILLMGAGQNPGPSVTGAIASHSGGPTPVFSMPLNEGGSATTAIDTIGGNNGTWSGTQSCSGSYYVNLPPNVGCFDGSTNKVTLTSVGALNLTTSITVMAWVYWTGGIPVSTIRPHIYSNMETSAPYNGVHLYLTNAASGLPKYLSFEVGNTSSWKARYTTSAIPSNTWLCVAGTYDGTNAYIYLNGTPQSTGLSSANPWGAGVIGSSSQIPQISYSLLDASGDYWQGQIAGVQVYNTALTAGQITTACGTAP